jgi:CRP-like cAMP-binding protein
MIIREREAHTKICNICINNVNSVFKPFTKDEKTLLRDNMTVIKYKKGDFIYQEGGKPEGLICLAKGNVKVFKAGIGSREQIVRLATSVGFIGYRAMFARENHIASAVAITDCEVSIVSTETVNHFLKTNIDFSFQIIRALATDLGFSNRRTVTLTQKHIRGRLAEALLVLVDTYGYENDNQTINGYLSREDLANLSNMTTSNAIRTLSCFANEEVIELGGRKIKVIDKATLDNISNIG